MNRRDFLLLLSAAACGQPRGARRNGSSGSAAAPADGQAISDDWSLANASQLRRSPLVARGEQIAYATRTELAFYDAGTLARIASVPATFRGLCVLPGGTLLAFAHGESGRCTVEVFEHTQIERALALPDCLPTDGMRLVAGAASELYVSRGSDMLVRYRIEDERLVEIDHIVLEDRAARNADQALGLGDGRVIIPAGKALQIYAPGKKSLAVPAVGSVAHVAAGTAGRVWCSVRTGERIERVVLVELAGGQADAVTSMAPGRVIHMASGASGELAMLVTSVREDTVSWKIAIVDERLAERAGFTIDDDIVTKVGTDLNGAFVALTPQRVVLAVAGHGLFAWDRATQRRVAYGETRTRTR